MPNQVTLNFTGCVPTPANGYVIMYRPVGSTIAYRMILGVTVAPYVFTDSADADGTNYEGFLQSDCGNGSLGNLVPFNTTPSNSPTTNPPGSLSISGTVSLSGNNIVIALSSPATCDLNIFIQGSVNNSSASANVIVPAGQTTGTANNSSFTCIRGDDGYYIKRNIQCADGTVYYVYLIITSALCS